MLNPRALAICLALATSGSVLAAQEGFRLREVDALAHVPPAQMEARTIVFSEPRGEAVDPATGLIAFADWERLRPLQKEWLSLYPGYREPVLNVTLHGVTKPYKKKLHMYVAEARLVLSKPPSAVNPARYASLQFLEKVDPAIKHRSITSAEAVPHKDADSAYNRHPQRRWCEGAEAVCIESRYQLEGKLPMGIRLANKLEEGGKKIAEHLEFQSEIRPLPLSEANQAQLVKLTGLDTPVTGAVEQNMFHVNQIMTFAKLLAVFQKHPSDPGKTVVTALLALAVKSDVLEKKKEFENVPVLRNLVPAQVLVGNSSFNTGTSISAGLPKYARNRIQAIAGILESQ